MAKIDSEDIKSRSPSPELPKLDLPPPPPNTGLAAGLNSGVFLHFDKKLADCVKQFPCLYDSKTVGYKDKKTALKAWDIVAKELEVENGEHAQKLYFNLKKRFHKRRNFLKRLQRSGTTNTLILKKARNDVSVYAFLDWLIPFTQVRQPRIPIKAEEADAMECKYAPLDMDDFDERPSFIDLNRNYDHGKHNGNHAVYVKQENVDDDTMLHDEDEILTVRPSSPMVMSSSPNLSRPVSTNSINNTAQNDYRAATSSQQQIGNSVYHNGHATATNNFNTESTSHDRTNHNSSNVRSSKAVVEDELLGDPNNAGISNDNMDHVSRTHGHDVDVRTRSKDLNNSTMSGMEFMDNEDHLFGLMVGAELKCFPYKERCIAKLKIQNILFDVQMSLLKTKGGAGGSEKKESNTV